MKKITGIPININQGIVGKITTKSLRLFNRRNKILVTRDLNRKFIGYTAVISDARSIESYLKKKNMVPLYYSVSELENFKDGNIVFLGKDGNISVLYEKEFQDNALLLTENCNCDCIMCPQERRKEAESRTPMNIKIISLMEKSTKHLGLTGGEPTLINDELLKIIEACKKYIPNAQIDILTNGIKLDDFEFVKKIATLQHSNLLFAIPLYADTDSEHNDIIKAKGFYRTIEGMYNLALFKQRIEIRVVLHKLTYRRLLKLAEFIYHNFPFVYHIAFMGMETRYLAEKNIVELWVDPHDYMPQLKEAVQYLSQRLMKVSLYNLQLCIIPNELWPYAKKSISRWKNIYLNACSECDYMSSCGGFFETSVDKHSSYINPIKKLDNSLQK